jgi:hypothetical protein
MNPKELEVFSTPSHLPLYEQRVGYVITSIVHANMIIFQIIAHIAG